MKVSGCEHIFCYFCIRKWSRKSSKCLWCEENYSKIFYNVKDEIDEDANSLSLSTLTLQSNVTSENDRTYNTSFDFSGRVQSSVTCLNSLISDIVLNEEPGSTVREIAKRSRLGDTRREASTTFQSSNNSETYWMAINKSEFESSFTVRFHKKRHVKATLTRRIKYGIKQLQSATQSRKTCSANGVKHIYLSRAYRLLLKEFMSYLERLDKNC